MVRVPQPALPVALAQLAATAAIRAAYGGGGAVPTVLGLILSPAAVVLVQLHGARLGGTRFGVWAGAVAVALPLLGIAYALPTYRSTYTHDSLPSLVGLEHPGWYAIGVGLAAVALVVPRFALAAAGIVAAVVAVVVWGVAPLSDLRSSLHEAGWSIAFVEWLVVAGVAGALRRSVLVATGFAGWLVFFVLRAAHQPFAGGHFWQALAPAAPAAALLAAAIASLAPRLRPASRASRAEAR